MISRFLCLAFAALPLSALAADARVVRDGVEFSVTIRSPEQQAAFYAARGFPEGAIRQIAATCFLTSGVYNRSGHVVWLELDRWTLTDAHGRKVERITRETWDETWERMKLPLASRATFGWTQLPEIRDLQPGEPAGGNIAIQAPAGRFDLHAHFRTGAEGKGAPVEFWVKDLVCPQGAQGK